MSPKNHPDLFPDLRQITLKKHADKWINQYDYLNSIILYEAPSKSPYGKKYVLVFELPKPKPEDKELKNRIRLFIDTFAHFNGIPEIDDLFFREVHKSQTKGDYRDEWLFLISTTDNVTLYHGDLTPAVVDGHSIIRDNSWVLYERHKTEKPSLDSPAILGLIDRAREELVFLYRPVERVRDKGHYIDRNKKRQGVALLHFDKNRGAFKLIKREYLEDFTNFNFFDQHKRGTIGRLLQQIVKNNGLGIFSYQKLYRKFQLTKPD